MILLSACILGALVLAIVMSMLAILAVGTASVEASPYDGHDFRRAIWEEREALRILRARYARGLVSTADYRRLSYELETGSTV